MIHSSDSRPEFAVFIATSLDGYIARSNGDVDWLEPFNRSGEDYGFSAFLDTVHLLVMGRHSYEQIKNHQPWPYTHQRIIVLSKHEPADDHRVEWYSGPVESLAKQLRAEDVRRVYVDGGATICQFLQAKLIDHFILNIVPVILGRGIPLFQHELPETDWQLEHTQSFESGLVQLTYRRTMGKKLYRDR